MVSRTHGLPTTPHPDRPPPLEPLPPLEHPSTPYIDQRLASPSTPDFTRSPPDSARLSGDLGRMSLPPHMREERDSRFSQRSQVGERRRESRQDSEDQAAGIFDLYDTDTDGEGERHAAGEGERESWRSGRGGQSGHGLEVGYDHRGEREELREPDTPASQRFSKESRASQGSWEGPFSSLSNPDTTSGSVEPRHSAFAPNGDGAQPYANGGSHPHGNGSGSGSVNNYGNGNGDGNGHGVSVPAPAGGSRRSSLAPPIPPITVTPDKSALAHIVDRERGHQHHRDSSLSGSTSTSTSLAPSPKRLSMSRLSPAKAVRANGSASTSQVSVAASSQYPGEENDAFYVRSTYARLEAEGVHGDGWDPGVERTRGGPQQGKRATMFEASKDGDVGQAEREYLASLDRYGFVNEPLRNRSETRLALIPTAPLLKIPKLPNSSPIPPGTPVPPPPAFDGREGPAPRSPAPPKSLPGEEEKRRRKEDERVSKWMKMMSVRKRDQGGNTVSWGWREAEKAKVTKRIYKGVPDRWRMAAWWTMAEDTVGRWKGKGKETRSAEQLAEEYRHRIDLASTHDVQIDLDVPRTISGHTLFVTRYGAGQRSLFHVLHCFSLLCDTCGYCQGMGPIAATLLCYFEPERVYALMVRLHDIYGMHSIFAPGFPGLLEAFYVQERLMEFLIPDVYKSFQRNMISSSAWGTKWYITLFVNTLPFSQQLRLWDALWLEGRDVMIVTSIAILWSFQDLLSAPNANFESILSLLSSYFVAEDEDALMRFIRKVLAQPGLRAKMDRWREEWAGLVREGKSGRVLL